MTALDFSQGHKLEDQLSAIEEDLADRQDKLENAARQHFLKKRDREKARARAFLSNGGTVAERNAHADIAISVIGVEEEAEYEAVKAVVRVLETRASIIQTLARVGR